MTDIRAFLRDHRQLAALLVALALCLKALVPAGYMIGSQTKVLTISICADSIGRHLTRQIAVPQTGKAGGGESDDGKSSSQCPFTALAMASLSGAGVALLVLALAFILALGFAPVRPLHLERLLHLRPPLRGPPAPI